MTMERMLDDVMDPRVMDLRQGPADQSYVGGMQQSDQQAASRKLQAVNPEAIHFLFILHREKVVKID